MRPTTCRRAKITGWEELRVPTEVTRLVLSDHVAEQLHRLLNFSRPNRQPNLKPATTAGDEKIGNLRDACLCRDVERFDGNSPKEAI